jgi:16S rRNA (uracil1498-N3)-methyltransferase
MSIRLFVEGPLAADVEMALPPTAARHAQVRRVQPGDGLVLFDGGGSDWPATVLRMGRLEVLLRVGAPQPVHNELPSAITLALGMPANERMDTLVEKATEMGVACIQPLHTERSVLRLQGERAQRKCAHWQAIAQAACEQSGRACVPCVLPVMALADWLQAQPPADVRLVLSLQADALPLTSQAGLLRPASVVFLSGPEGGLAPHEEVLARASGFAPTTLGPRVLRADTAPLVALAWLGLRNLAPQPPTKAG